MTDISINIQSYKRAGNIDTLGLFPHANIWVHEFELADYQKLYTNVHSLPDDLRGNLPKVKNYILDQQPGKTVLFLDDDISKIGHWEHNQAYFLTPDTIEPFLAHYTLLCEELGSRLWGINVNQDKQVYREYSPFSTLSYISSSFSCFLATNTLRYDERFPLKEDYDMTIQQLNTYRQVLRVNKYFYVKKSATNTGGCATYRNMDREHEQLKLLQQKWGDKIVKFDTNNRSHSSIKLKSFDINPVITIPMRGI